MPDETGPQRDARATQWYGASKEDLRNGVRILRDLLADFAANGAVHLDRRKESLIKMFGVEFYDALEEWKGMSIDAILLAEHLVRHAETFGSTQPAPHTASDRNVVVDHSQKLQMLVKLVGMQMQHLLDLQRVYGQAVQIQGQVSTDFVPRYYAIASRDLQRSVDWYLYLREKGL